MIMGTNRVFAHGGRDYHLQIEDLGTAQAAFEARVYDQGALLWRKRVPYDEIVARGLPKTEQDEALAALMEKTLITVEAAIAKGRLG
jgi:hypothetical protein